MYNFQTLPVVRIDSKMGKRGEKNNKTRYSSRIAPINDALVRLAGCKAYKNKPYPILLTLYGPRNHLEKVASI